MPRETPLLAAALAWIVASSGCVTALALGGDEESVAIPAPRLGETWKSRTESAFRFDDQIDSSAAAFTVTFDKEPRTVPDKYGQPIEAYTFSTVYEPADAKGGGDDYFHVASTMSAFEKASGTWVIDGMTSYASAHTSTFDSRCSMAYEDLMWSHADAPIRFDFGKPWGQTLHVGDELTFTRTLPDQDEPRTLEVRLEVVEITTMPLTVDETTRDRLVAVIDQTSEVTPPYGETLSSSILGEPTSSVDRTYWADGISVPVRSERSVTGDRFAFTSSAQLLSYTQGEAAPEVGFAAPRAQYEGVHRDATLHLFGMTPTITSVPSEYPLEEAVQWIQTDPSLLRFQVWLKSNPNSYAFDGTYERYPADDEFTWTFLFTQGTDMYLVQTTKTFGPLGPTKDGDEANFGDHVSEWVPAPAQVQGAMLVDDATALGVGLYFLGDPDWKGFGWSAFTDGPDSSEPNFQFFVATGGRETEPGVLPMTGGFHKDWLAPIRSVDARTGAVLGGSGASWSCADGLTLPLFNEAPAFEPPGPTLGKAD